MRPQHSLHNGKREYPRSAEYLRARKNQILITFGFVRSDDGKDVFVHSTAIRETIHKYLRAGEKVEFDVVQTVKGPQARDLRILLKS
jgi:CspA family cold shock protein